MRRSNLKAKPTHFLSLLMVIVVCQCTPSVRSTSQATIPPQTLAVTTVRGNTEAEFVQHVNALKKRLPSDQFSIIIERPFVVVGDEPRAVVEQHARDTIRWAVTLLKQDFFTEDPKQILDIWLFKDAASYEKNANALFVVKPTTPFGYYSSTDKALIMNINTGGGTLVHELVHPFMEANFPTCPPWLNEGLGSLYEQCGEVDGHIHGFVNWRLPGLQRAIKARNLPTFRELTSMDANTFYGDSRGTNYGQARYLCHYLQEENLLIKFYHLFLARKKADPTGFNSLQQVLGTRDMNAFQKKWEKYVLDLKQ